MISAVIFQIFHSFFLKKIQGLRAFSLTSKSNLSKRFVGQVTELATFEITLYLYTEKFEVFLIKKQKIYKKFTKSMAFINIYAFQLMD